MSQQSSLVKQIITRFGIKLSKLATQQEEVAENREQVLVDRGNLVRSGKRVREQRDRTANAEVSFMNVLRKYHNSIGVAFPTEIDVAFSKVDQERTKLGLLEVEHTELDNDLGAQEWSFMDKENELYQYDLQLLSDEIADDVETTDAPLESQQVFSENRITSSAIVQYQVETTEYSRLRMCFRTFRNAIAKLFDTTTLDIDEADLVDIDTSEAVLRFDQVLTKLAECEVRMQHLKGKRMQTADIQSSKVRHASEPLLHTESRSNISNTSGKAYSEGTAPHHVDQIPVMHRVREWLLDCLKQNALDKMQYASILQRNMDYIENIELECLDWEVPAPPQWHFDTMMSKPSTQIAAVIESSSDRRINLDSNSNHSQILYEQKGEGQHMAPQSERLKSECDVQRPEHQTPIDRVVGIAAPIRCDSAQESTKNEPFHPASLHMPAIVKLGDDFCLADSLYGPEEGRARNVQSNPDASFTTRSRLVYSTWKWSPELQHYYMFGFTEDGDVAEAVWSEPISEYPVQDRESHSTSVFLVQPDRLGAFNSSNLILQNSASN